MSSAFESEPTMLDWPAKMKTRSVLSSSCARSVPAQARKSSTSATSRREQVIAACYPARLGMKHLLARGTILALISSPAFAAPGGGDELAGYLLVDTEKVPDEFNAGFSLYAAAWPLLAQYPGHDFQTGLFGTWMHAQYAGEEPKDLYSDIEGGLGWW